MSGWVSWGSLEEVSLNGWQSKPGGLQDAPSLQKGTSFLIPGAWGCCLMGERTWGK